MLKVSRCGGLGFVGLPRVFGAGGLSVGVQISRENVARLVPSRRDLAMPHLEYSGPDAKEGGARSTLLKVPKCARNASSGFPHKCIAGPTAVEVQDPRETVARSASPRRDLAIPRVKIDGYGATEGDGFYLAKSFQLWWA